MRGIRDHIGVCRHICKDRRRKICIYKVYERYMGAFGCRDICMYIHVLQRLVLLLVQGLIRTHTHAYLKGPGSLNFVGFGGYQVWWFQNLGLSM